MGNIANALLGPATPWIIGGLIVLILLCLAVLGMSNSKWCKLRCEWLISKEDDWLTLLDYVTRRAHIELADWLASALDISLTDGHPPAEEQERFDAFLDLVVMFRYYFNIEVGPKPQRRVISTRLELPWRTAFFLRFIRGYSTCRVFQIGPSGLVLRRPMKSTTTNSSYPITRELLRKLNLKEAMQQLFNEGLTNHDNSTAQVATYVRVEPGHTAIEWLNQL